MADNTEIPLTDKINRESVTFVGITAALYGLTFLVLCLRVFTRIRPVYGLRWDDWLMIAGFVFTLIVWALILSTSQMIQSIHGRHSVSIAGLMQGFKTAYISMMIWPWAVCCIKLSIGLTLLRFFQEKGWRILLYVLNILQVCFALGYMLLILLQCRQISALWNSFLPQSKCLSASKIRVGTMTGTVFHITTDLIISLLPLAFIVRLHIPTTQKILVGFLMGLGIFASGASIQKTMVIQRYSTRDTVLLLKSSVEMATWSCVELGLGIMAGSLPCLKSLMGECFRRTREISSLTSASRSRRRDLDPEVAQNRVRLNSYHEQPSNHEVALSIDDAHRGSSKGSADTHKSGSV